MNESTRSGQGKPLVSRLTREELDIARALSTGTSPDEVAAQFQMKPKEFNKALSNIKVVTGNQYDELFKLTPMQARICRAAITGLSNEQIAKQFALEEGTIKVHLRTAFRKLGISRRIELGDHFAPDYVIDTPYVGLTGLQLSIINKVAEAKSDPEITEILGVSRAVVQSTIRDLTRMVNDLFIENHPELDPEGEEIKDYLISNRTQLSNWWAMNLFKKAQAKD